MSVDLDRPQASDGSKHSGRAVGWVVSLVLWVLVTVAMPNRWWLAHLLSAVALGVLSGWHGLAPAKVARRTLLVLPFVVLMTIGLLTQPDWPVRLAGAIAKAVLSLWLILLLTHILTPRELMAALRQLRLPPLLIELAAFMLRYSVVLREEWQRMQLARLSRTFQSRPLAEFSLLARSLGLLFLRAFERAEHVHQAMLARGYEHPR